MENYSKYEINAYANQASGTFSVLITNSPGLKIKSHHCRISY
jgi:hypothetical protein